MLVALAVLAALGLVAVGRFPGVRAGEAHAAGAYPNASIADIALQYVGQWGGNACGGTPLSASGQCKQFANCIVWKASGGTQQPWPGYASGFQRAGGIQQDATTATKGDIIQIGGDASVPSGMLHTAIIVQNLGSGRFDVVDSNWGYTETVHHHVWAPPSGYTIWRMGTVQVAPPPPPGHH